jgi:hypothetical protein
LPAANRAVRTYRRDYFICASGAGHQELSALAGGVAV